MHSRNLLCLVTWGRKSHLVWSPGFGLSVAVTQDRGAHSYNLSLSLSTSGAAAYEDGGGAQSSLSINIQREPSSQRPVYHTTQPSNPLSWQTSVCSLRPNFPFHIRQGCCSPARPSFSKHVKPSIPSILPSSFATSFSRIRPRCHPST